MKSKNKGNLHMMNISLSSATGGNKHSSFKLNQFEKNKNDLALKDDIERLLIENDNSFVESSELSYNSFLNN